MKLSYQCNTIQFVFILLFPFSMKIHKNMTMILEGSDGGGSDIEVDAGEFNKESLEEEMEVGEDDEACIDEGNIHGQLLMSLEDVKVRN